MLSLTHDHYCGGPSVWRVGGCGAMLLLIGLMTLRLFTRVTLMTGLMMRIRFITRARWIRLRTFSDRLTMLKRASRSTVLIFSMLASAPVMVVASLAMMPRSFSSSTRISTENSPSTFGSQRTETHFSGLSRISAMLLQVSVWMTMPRPELM